MPIELRELRAGDQERLADVDGGNGRNADPALWASYLADHQIGRRTVLIAWTGERPLGYGNLFWRSEYEPFQSLGIPEINNLGVDVAFRRRGIATRLILAFEDNARRSGRHEIGLGVGLYADYGDAQRLYWRLGYRPDGRGVTYNGRTVFPGEHVRLDDDLILWLSKSI
jgi:GNAT superfamily N-acetyltransferase